MSEPNPAILPFEAAPAPDYKDRSTGLVIAAIFHFVGAGPAVWRQGAARVAQPSPAAGSGTVPVRVSGTGGETPLQPAGGDACATI